MRGYILTAAFAFLALGATARAADLVEINGELHGTGLLQRPEGLKLQGVEYARMDYDAADLPAAYDARESGCVTPTKNQGQCGSCWSFSRTKALEAAWCLAKGDKTIDLAEQDTLVNDTSAAGCQGGYMDGSYETSHGVTTEAACPYKGSDRYRCAGAVKAKAAHWMFIGAAGRSPTLTEIKAAVMQYKVVSVTVSASSAFSPRNGHIKTCQNGQLNHMIVVTGWDGDELLIQNSWGTNWGAGGFAYTKQGCNSVATGPESAMVFAVE
jgi:C1A family cysteine protease